MPFGIVEKIYHEEYLTNHVCYNCNKDLDTKLVIYCCVFTTGFITWWAWNKRGYTECNNCGKTAYINTRKKEFQNVQAFYTRKSMPWFYFVPSIVVGLFLLIIIGEASLKTIYNLSTTTEEKLLGVWEKTDGSGSLYIFKDHQYTLVEKDTILFGKYDFDDNSNIVRLPTAGKGNKIEAVDPRNLTLTVMYGMDETFAQTVSSTKGDNPYQPQYNRWREKATHEETNTEIKIRVINYLTFLKRRYDWVLINHLQRLQPDPNSPLFEAMNGIALYKDDYHRWRSIFYNEDNYLSGNKFLLLAFPKNFKYDENENNVFRQNLSLIEAYIKSAESRDLP
jgi:hypothetical protein